MPVCRYYLQGNCRYGDRCWYDHIDDNRGPTQRGDYYVSNDNRSLWRKDFHQSNAKQSGFSTSNRFASLSQDSQHSQRRQNHYEDDFEESGAGQPFYIQGSGSFGKQYGTNVIPSKFGPSHLNSAQQQHRSSTVDFSFNAASQGIQNSRPTFSFTSALNKQLANEQFPQTKVLQNQPVNFSFKASQNQLNSNRVVVPPQNSDFGRNPAFSFTSTLNKQLSNEQQQQQHAVVKTGQGPVSFSFKSAQNQLNTPTVGINRLSQTKTLFGRAVSEERTQTTDIIIDKNVPSILATSDVLTVLSLYSSLSQLSDSDKEQFQAPKFTGGRIPTVPPPQELC